MKINEAGIFRDIRSVSSHGAFLFSKPDFNSSTKSETSLSSSKPFPVTEFWQLIARPDILRILVREGELSQIAPANLMPYLQCRADYYSEGLNKVFVDGERGSFVPNNVPSL